MTVQEVLASGLLLQNFREVRPGEKLNPELTFLQAAEDSGLIFCVGAIADGEIVGYSATFVHTDMYTNQLMAANDVIYLAPKHRSGRTAWRLVEETERQAKELGAAFLSWSPLIDTGFCRLLDRLGYAPRTVSYRKELSDV